MFARNCPGHDTIEAKADEGIGPYRARANTKVERVDPNAWSSTADARSVLLPRVLDLPASDGRYYYFCNSTTITNFTVSTLCDVSIIGTNTGMAGGIVLPVTSTLRVYMNKALTLPPGTSNLNILGERLDCAFIRRRPVPV